MNKWTNVALHATFWILFFVVPYLLQPGFEGGGRRGPAIQPSSLYFNLVKCIFWMGVFYLNSSLLVPQLVYKRKYVAYGLALLASLLALSMLEYSYFSMFRVRARFRLNSFLMFNIFPFLFIVAASTVYRMFLDKAKEQRTSKERESETLKSELSFLRSQISPHFMFNVINNIVALARKKSDLVEPSLIKLSSLMRYFIYESNEEKVSIHKEIEYLQSYIDLQQQRFGNSVAIKFTTQEIDANYEIEPMLLIPFVENAFKHGVVADGIIEIELSAKSHVLHFKVVNNYNEIDPGIKDETSGIGLANVKRRLNLLYKNNHSLLIDKKDGLFTVSLEIKLK
jgi:sensor histidine kinase YesM